MRLSVLKTKHCVVFIWCVLILCFQINMYDPLFVYVGRVLNRFSKDIGFIDAILPYQTVDFLTVSNGK